jgi:Phage tail baseplate hub (GPD)
MLDTDFAFHWDSGGAGGGRLHVVSFTLEDTISAPYELKLLLHARTAEGEIDPFELLGKLGTLRISTGTTPPERSIHGMIVSAEDKGTTRAGSLYEVVLLPPFGRAMHRKRSRIFPGSRTGRAIASRSSTRGGICAGSWTPAGARSTCAGRARGESRGSISRRNRSCGTRMTRKGGFRRRSTLPEARFDTPTGAG